MLLIKVKTHSPCFRVLNLMILMCMQTRNSFVIYQLGVNVVFLSNNYISSLILIILLFASDLSMINEVSLVTKSVDQSNQVVSHFIIQYNELKILNLCALFLSFIFFPILYWVVNEHESFVFKLD